MKELTGLSGGGGGGALNVFGSASLAFSRLAEDVLKTILMFSLAPARWKQFFSLEEYSLFKRSAAKGVETKKSMSSPSITMSDIMEKYLSAWFLSPGFVTDVKKICCARFHRSFASASF
jgi:hypothetical protein